MIRIENLKVREDLTKEELLNFIVLKKKINKNDIKSWQIFKKSIDARNKKDIFYNYTIDMECKNESKIKNVKKVEKLPDLKIDVKRKSEKKPIIIGAGPSGLFCALILVENGIKPIIIEQGSKVEERKNDVENFRQNAILNTFSNVQFGEGGAGTFSDGKLTSNASSIICKEVAKYFYKFGAPEEILYTNKPHIGTDKLLEVIKNIREYIISKGGKFLFNTKVIDFDIENNKISKVKCKKVKFQEERNLENIEIETDTVVLAIGHSARDTFYKLYEKGFELERKNFSVGVRIEHKQKMINESQYGIYTRLNLPPAEYKLAYHGKNRSCYTFCMCPRRLCYGLIKRRKYYCNKWNE